ncbi:RagB/SusD family nutrient uptake outer membrane protein [Myroides marinus]|uniref:RagB/SusD family nutrient uptake outer membrane protein n=1 Tax=Myroides marinus TaxID=703342 RepID=UPI0025776F3D|nr:RagB/SusD family nutrient uptake outer membrane protein [Myroides marinus]MDM1374998.1 RagB/SusD family nutrient uptake outer membrane protein [Myroides marinus]MDM1532270.1 RagB/SusD family nutrient uptake outer membrane protein [Myroides marinus]MDM1539232.1 RagB/SusD family nutrient uptake outer membrane protein [Myroides marinus]
MKKHIIKNRFKLFVALTVVSVSVSSCSKEFLDETTYGEVSPDKMTEPKNVERVIIGAYKMLNGQMDNASNAMNSPASNWSFGDVTSDDAYKGGGGTGDQGQIHRMELYQTDATIIDVERKWSALYEGIKRVNDAIRLLANSKGFDPELKKQRQGELFFLRGHYYFELKKIYDKIPYIDETVVKVEDYNRSNVEFTSDQLWQKIADDFTNATELLPVKQTQIGRPTNIAAKAYLMKTLIYQKKWQQAYNISQEVITSQYGLLGNFEDVFLPENDNSQEVIFAVQHSINDGDPNNYNGSIGDRLTAPGGPFYPQYGFHRPSQNLVNAFKTDTNGLPVTDNVDVKESDFVDPRLDYTVGRPGITYKDLGIVYESSWARDLATYGQYAPKKRIVSANSPYYGKTWPYVSALNYYIIRYAEVLLWRAEAAVELGNLEEARSIVNTIRNRAKNSNYVKTLDGKKNAANYKIGLYTNSWSDVNKAREAVHLETRLELALEGERFFNLVRWGVAEKVLNQDYLKQEKQKRSFLTNANFTKGKNEYFPIPQRYIDGATSKVVQNPNY